MKVVTKLFRLAVRWNPKDREIHLEISPRSTNADMHWLAGIFNKAFTDELTARGYDLSTLRFHIDKRQSAIDHHFRIYPESPFRELYEQQSGRKIEATK